MNEQCLFQFIPITETQKALFEKAAFKQVFNEKDHNCKENEYRASFTINSLTSYRSHDTDKTNYDAKSCLQGKLQNSHGTKR